MTPMSKKNAEKEDSAWQHCFQVKENNKVHLKRKCKCCGKEVWAGMTKMKAHLDSTPKDAALRMGSLI